jgi:hypothetical protein
MTDDVGREAARYRLQAAYVGRGHYLAAEAYEWWNRALGVPVVVGSTALASSIFARWDASPNTWWSTISGVLAAAVAVLAALQTFLKFSERSATHKAAGANYGEIRRRFDLFMLQHQDGAEAPRTRRLEELGLLTDRLAQLASTSPHLPARYYGRAREEQAAETAAYQALAAEVPVATP